MQSDLQVVMRLQSLDGRVAQLTKEIATLPKHIAEIEKKLSGGERKLEADKGALAAKTNDQYRVFQHEIEFCENEIKKCEDRILELMGQSEPLEKNVKVAEASLKLEKQAVEAEKAEARERTAKDQAALKELFDERKSIVASLNPGLVSNYERIKKTRGGIAIAEAIEGRCSRCFISLRPQFFLELKRGDKVMTCESCNRILYYAKPESFEDLIRSPLV
jgi:predicted  nucleic acid-binding Zn-ribbon protein